LKGVLVGSPANPTGTMMSREALTGLMAAAEGAGIRFISDENLSRSRLCISGRDRGRAFAAGAGDQLVLEIFLHDRLAGRLDGGAGAAVRPIERLQQNLSISVPTLSQIAAEAAFEGREEMEAIKRGYQENRRILIDGLPKAGLTKFLPADGAFYLYADVSDFTSDSFEFASRMLEKAHVAATPGVDFDPVHGRSFIRFSYARSADEMREAVARIAPLARLALPAREKPLYGDMLCPSERCPRPLYPRIFPLAALLWPQRAGGISVCCAASFWLRWEPRC